MKQPKPAEVTGRSGASIAYGLLDLLLASLYVFVFFRLAPSRESTFTAIVLGLSALLAAGGLGMLSGRAWGRKIATVASVTLLLACAVFIALLLASAAYLHGIYNGIGEAGAVISILVALLAVQLVGLVPALQLAHLRRLARREPQVEP